MSLTNELISKLHSIDIQAGEVDYSACGYHLDVCLNHDQVRRFAQTLLDDGFYLVFVTAVHIKPRFQIVYQFAHFEFPCRVNARAHALDDGSVPTISDIYHGANWHERETHDFYGVTFTGHTDLRTLLLSEEDHDLKPLLKGEDKLKDLEGITRKAAQMTDTKATNSPE